MGNCPLDVHIRPAVHASVSAIRRGEKKSVVINSSHHIDTIAHCPTILNVAPCVIDIQMAQATTPTFPTFSNIRRPRARRRPESSQRHGFSHVGTQPPNYPGRAKLPCCLSSATELPQHPRRARSQHSPIEMQLHQDPPDRGQIAPSSAHWSIARS